MVNAGQVLSKAQILDHVLGLQLSAATATSFEPCISYPAAQGPIRGEPRLIHTIRGVGYMLRVAAAVRSRPYRRLRTGRWPTPRCGSG